MRSRRSISPTDCSDEASRLRIARRFGSTTISNTDVTVLIYRKRNIRVKAYMISTYGRAGASTMLSDAGPPPSWWASAEHRGTDRPPPLTRSVGMRASRLIALVVGLLVAGAGSAHVMAAPKVTAPITVLLGGLGCNTAVGADTFAAQSWQWGASSPVVIGGSGGGQGKASVSELVMTRAADACSP